MSHYWLIAVPKGKGKNTDPIAQLRRSLEQTKELTAKFEVPDLKVGTLDALLALSDDLAKIDIQVEATTRKIALQLTDLPGDTPLAIGGVGISLVTMSLSRLANFQRRSVRYRHRLIFQHVGKLEDELRAKASEYHTVHQSIAVAERQKTGTLIQRSLLGIVKKEHWGPESENLVTLFVVIPRFGWKDWENSYETLTELVVPRSSKMIYEDKEHGLFTVLLFQRKVDEFKHKAREARFFVRDYTRSDFDAQMLHGDDAQKLQASLEEHQTNLLRWCRVNFAEAFTAWIHLKAIRIFVESVLRFGLPTNFQAILLRYSSRLQIIGRFTTSSLLSCSAFFRTIPIRTALHPRIPYLTTQPSKKEDPKLRKLLMAEFGHLGQGQFGGKEEDEPTGLHQDKDFYPYVYTAVDCDFHHH